MRKNPRVSVILSVFNGEKYLKECINSILIQTFSDFEFVIIDDGSTDNTLNILKSIKDSRIVLVSRENRGLVSSLNEGIKLAKGAYIARQDADDKSKPDRLLQQVRYLDEHSDVSVLGTFSDLIDGRGNRQGSYETPFLAQDVKRRLYLGNTLVHGSIMARREVMINHPYVSIFGPTEDYVLWGDLSKDHELAVLPIELYTYRINEGSLSAFNSREDASQTRAAHDMLWDKKCFPGSSAKDLVYRGGVYKRSGMSNIYSQYLSDQVQLICELKWHGVYRPLLSNFLGLAALSPRAAIRSLILINRRHV